MNKGNAVEVGYLNAESQLTFFYHEKWVYLVGANGYFLDVVDEEQEVMMVTRNCLCSSPCGIIRDGREVKEGCPKHSKLLIVSFMGKNLFENSISCLPRKSDSQIRDLPPKLFIWPATSGSRQNKLSVVSESFLSQTVGYNPGQLYTPNHNSKCCAGSYLFLDDGATSRRISAEFQHLWDLSANSSEGRPGYS